ncbi:MAG: Crp/Fnr family transcriptional regulator [Bradyrhizobium sp.]|uniref:Crp/Fnr family transcriptional regulator n=1 Tax=Bradyrhizobium sp. TaxID=376 RepID=UPI0025C3D19D|nr:Crp/Fnr family transcriptional regulator [Bradyrhizobium sp.]MBI5260806.1 Crp/Fnr family transcriptional regulator [Bradyrhizobium sp.]
MKNISPCASCPRYGVGFCDAVLGRTGAIASGAAGGWQHHRVVPAGRQIVARNQASPDLFVLCNGWGFRFLQLADGRRQILGFLLPGDLFSVASVFEERFHFSVKALTDVQISTMRRTEVQSRLAADPTIVMALAETCSSEARCGDEMIAALGQYSAEERIAFLLLNLTERIAARNVIREQQYPFPLRQQHVADAVGLTAVHVSRVLGVFRDRRVVEMSNGVLKVHDVAELKRLGSLS